MQKPGEDFKLWEYEAGPLQPNDVEIKVGGAWCPGCQLRETASWQIVSVTSWLPVAQGNKLAAGVADVAARQRWCPSRGCSAGRQLVAQMVSQLTP